MKNILNAIKTLLLTGVITIFTIIPVVAQDTIQPNQDPNIIGVYTESNDNFYIEKGDVITEYADGTYYINSDVEIQSIDEINNTITIIKNDGELYSFYDDNVRNYFLGEQINITMDQDSKIIDCAVDSKPIIYDTTIDSINNDIATLNINGNKYTFINEEGSDGWIIGDKCKAVIQDGRLLEVQPIPLAER